MMEAVSTGHSESVINHKGNDPETKSMRGSVFSEITGLAARASSLLFLVKFDFSLADYTVSRPRRVA